MFLNKRTLLLRTLNLNKGSSLLNKNVMKLFSSNHSSNGHDSHDNHGGHGHDDHGHHHEITGEVDLNKVYIPLNAEISKFISMTGAISPFQKEHIVSEGQMKARNAVTPIPIPVITRNKVFYRDLANVPYEENPYFHPEPYGYLVSDDVKIKFNYFLAF